MPSRPRPEPSEDLPSGEDGSDAGHEPARRRRRCADEASAEGTSASAGSSRGPADDDEDDVEDMDDMGSDSDDASPTNKGKPNGKRPAGPLKTSDS